MPDDDTQEPSQEEASGTEVTEKVEEKTDEQEAEEADAVLDHEAALKELAKARKEAGNYRTKLREVEDKFKDAKTSQEFEAALEQVRTERLVLEREIVGKKWNLPDRVAARLVGTTREELEADAKALAADLNTVIEDESTLSGGLSGGNGAGSDASLSPAELVKKYGKRHR